MNHSAHSAMGSLENRKEAMLKRLAERNEQRILKTHSSNIRKAVDLRATEKAFLDSSPSAINIKTPLNPSNAVIHVAGSPIMSIEERAEKQMVALATWANTMNGIDSSEEMDLGATTAEATRRIQKMLSGKKQEVQKTSSRYQKLFETNDSGKIREECQKLLIESGIEESIRTILSKSMMTIRKENSVYSDLSLQTTLLRIFLSFHPAWLKVSLEAIFNTEIDSSSKSVTRTISQLMIENVFSNPKMMKNKKFAQGSGVPIVTPAGRKALHDYFLETIMKMMFLIETAYSHRLIPNLHRIFTKSSQFKSLTDVFSELTRELLTGSSADFRKAFSGIGFKPTYKQSFVENHNYEAKGFEDFSDGLLLAKLIETVGELPHGQLLYKLRDPAGDRIRKVKNVETVLKEMLSIGISTEDVTASAIVGGKKEAIVSILWSIVGVRVAKEKKIRYQRPPSNDLITPKKKKNQQSEVHDDLSSELLTTLKLFGKDLQVEVMDTNSIQDGRLLELIWSKYIPNGPQINSYSGTTSWEKIVTMAEVELQIPRGLDQNVVLFVKTFLERVQTIRNHENVEDSGDVIVQKPSEDISRQSMDSAWNDATFTVNRDSMDSLSGGGFKMPITPLRGTFTRTTIAKHLNEVIEEEEEVESVSGSIQMSPETIAEAMEAEEEDDDQTVVPSTPMRRTVLRNEISLQKTFPVHSEIYVDDSENDRNNEDVPNKELEKYIDTADVNTSNEAQKASDDTDFDSTQLSSCSVITEDVVIYAQDELKEDQDIPEDTPTPTFGSTQKELESDASISVNISTLESVQDVPEDVASEDTVLASSAESEPLNTPKDEVPIFAPQTLSALSMDTTQPGISESEIQLTEEQNKNADIFQSFVDNQKAFVAENKLSVVIEDPVGNTPKLRELLKEARQLKKKQSEVAKMLGAIEKRALASRDLQSASTSSTATIEQDRNDGGRDKAILSSSKTSNLEDKLKKLEKTLDFQIRKDTEEKKETSAVIIQKMIRGFLARRRFRKEIEEWREKMIIYNRVLAAENDQFVRDETTNSSVEMKLRNAALHGLTNENLHIVLIAATIINRITDLVPPLLEKFVVELNGIKLIYEILKVTDQGYSYKSILQPLLNCLRKSFISIPEEVTNSLVRPVLPKLSPRLFLLMLKHSTSPDLFNPIITTLISIGRRFPSEKDSGMKRWKNQIEQTMKKVTDDEGSKSLVTLQTICDHLI